VTGLGQIALNSAPVLAAQCWPLRRGNSEALTIEG